MELGWSKLQAGKLRQMLPSDFLFMPYTSPMENADAVAAAKFGSQIMRASHNRCPWLFVSPVIHRAILPLPPNMSTFSPAIFCRRATVCIYPESMGEEINILRRFWKSLTPDILQVSQEGVSLKFLFSLSLMGRIDVSFCDQQPIKTVTMLGHHRNEFVCQ